MSGDASDGSGSGLTPRTVPLPDLTTCVRHVQTFESYNFFEQGFGAGTAMTTNNPELMLPAAQLAEASRPNNNLFDFHRVGEPIQDNTNNTHDAGCFDVAILVCDALN